MYFGAIRKEKDALDSLLFKEIFSTDRLALDQEDPLTISQLESYVESIDKSSELWALQHSCIEKLSSDSEWVTQDLLDWLLRLNRVGMRHFKPLILGALNRMSSDNLTDTSETLVDLMKEIERFVFIMYELCEYRADQQAKTEFGNYGNGIFYSQEGYSFKEVVDALRDYLYCFSDDGEFLGYFDPSIFVNNVHARFHKDKGWLDWDAIKYFLSEWESDLGGGVVPAGKYINLSLEHIMPQNPDAPGQWMENQKELGKRARYVINDLGNLVLLGLGANKAVQDVDLKVKADAYQTSAGGKDVLERAGRRYSWGNSQILERGRAMVEFLLTRWNLPGQEEDSEFQIDAEDVLSVRVKPPRARSQS